MSATGMTNSALLDAYDRLREHPEIDGEGIELAMEFELLALKAGADPDWSRERLVRFERSRGGGLATLARYGRPYYRALAHVRWGKTPKGALPAIRKILRQKPPAPEPTPEPETEPTPKHEHRPENPDERIAA